MSGFYDANYNITNLKKSGGKITYIELNGEEVPMGSEMDDNKAATINVSTYTAPVEITPTSGKEGMKKVTVTLSNIPSGDSTLYCWKYDDSQQSNTYLIYTLSPTPFVDDTVIICSGESGIPHAPSMEFKVVTYENNAITIDDPSLEEVTFERYADGDILL